MPVISSVPSRAPRVTNWSGNGLLGLSTGWVCFHTTYLKLSLLAAALPLAPVFQNRPPASSSWAAQPCLFSLPGEGTDGSLEGSFGYLTKLYVILGSGMEM